MQLYKFNTSTLEYEPVKAIKRYPLVGFACILFILLGFTSYHKIHVVTKEVPVVVKTEEVPFSTDNLKKELKRLNVKFDTIIYKQAVLETGHFKSEKFIKDHNLFAMRKPSLRPTTVVGERKKYATFKNWQESVLDMAIWVGIYCRNIKTEEEYYKLLTNTYAEDPNYVKELKKLRYKD